MTTRIIRRYQNRKLYDPETSKTVTLAELAELIRQGEDIKVLDHQDRDITAGILAKIFVQEDLTAKGTILKKVLLEGLIYEGGEKMGTLLKKVMLAGIGLGRLTQEKVDQVVDELIKKGELAEDERSKFVKELFQKLEQKSQDLRQKVADLTHAVETEVKVVTNGQENYRELQERIESLTKQIEELRAEKGEAAHETDEVREKETVTGKRSHAGRSR